MRRPRPLPRFAPGDRVRLTGDFLRSTGQAFGGEGLSRWVVVGCACSLCEEGSHVAVNERSSFDPDRQRHMNRANLQRVGELVADHVPQGGFLKRILR